jgi:hypothetical protein
MRPPARPLPDEPCSLPASAHSPSRPRQSSRTRRTRPTPDCDAWKHPPARQAGRRATRAKQTPLAYFVSEGDPSRPRHLSDSTLSKQRSIDLAASDGHNSQFAASRRVISNPPNPFTCDVREIVSSPDRNGHVCSESRLALRARSRSSPTIPTRGGWRRPLRVSAYTKWRRPLRGSRQRMRVPHCIGGDTCDRETPATRRVRNPDGPPVSSR